MGTIEEVRQMQEEGRSEQEIMQILKQRGVSDREIGDVINQAKIKDAVDNDFGSAVIGTFGNQHGKTETTAPMSYSQEIVGGKSFEADYPPAQGYEEMQPSMLSQEAPAQAAQGYAGEYTGYGTDYAGGYQEYQPYQEAMSSELITEISEQVVSEKLAILKDKIDKVIDFGSVAEAKISNLDERLRRIEKIIDRLELSIMQRVGEYITDVRDIKHELEETQKSFKVLVGGGTRHGKSQDGKKRHP